MAAEAFVFPDDRPTEFDFLLLGLTLKPEPPSQVVPRNTATGIRIDLAFSDVDADASAWASRFGIPYLGEASGGPTAGAPVPSLAEVTSSEEREVAVE